MPPSSRSSAVSRGATAALLFVAFVALLVSRQPHVLTDANLWGDDGWSWYPDAYTIGIRCLAIPVNGYLNSVQRLVGLAVQPLPLLWVPAVFAFIGLAAQALAASFLCSRRLDGYGIPRIARLAFAVAMLLLPNEIELYGNLTNAQWWLAVLAFEVVMASPPRRAWSWAFDLSVLALSGLSGPFALLLGPTALMVLVAHRRKPEARLAGLVRLAVMALCAAIQLWVLATTPDHGSLPTPLGANPVLLARMIVRQVVFGLEFGMRAMFLSPVRPGWSSDAATWVTLAVALAAFGAACAVGGLLFRGFALYAVLVLAGGLVHPHASADMPQWVALTHPTCGSRYFAMLSLTFLAAMFVLAASRQPALRVFGIVLLLPMLLHAIPQSWRIESWHTDFAARARAFALAPPGTRMEFPQVPPGTAPMVLVKHP